MRRAWLATGVAFLGGTSAGAAIPVTVAPPVVAAGPPACNMPAVPRGAQLIAYGAYDADTLSSAYVGGPDQETNLTELVIEPGETPIYLLLTSYESMVWRLRGATGRVVRAAVTSHERQGEAAAVGVAGLPASRVTVLPPACPPYFHDVSRSTETSGQIARAVGRAPDRMFGAYSAYRVSLPSGTVERAPPPGSPTPESFNPQMWREASRFWPGGVAAIEPRSVTAIAPVGDYAVLPSQAGLAQWIGKGAIRRTADGFRLVRPMPHLPPGMGGAHSVRLIVSRGVPVPPGDPVHSCIVVEDEGAAHGATCGLSRPRRLSGRDYIAPTRFDHGSDGANTILGLTPLGWLFVCGGLAFWFWRRRNPSEAPQAQEEVVLRDPRWQIPPEALVKRPPAPVAPKFPEGQIAELSTLAGMTDSETLVVALHRFGRELRAASRDTFDADLADEINAITGRHFGHAIARYRQVRPSLEGSEADRADEILHRSLERLAGRLHELRDEQHHRDVDGIDEAARFINDRHPKS